jgi:quinoprotein glucose dehydrogenase
VVGAAAPVIAFFALPAAAQDSEPYAPHVEPASAEANLALEALDVIEGIACDLYAAEPMLANPVCLYVDHGGDLYVGETFRHYAGVTDIRDHMDWLDEDLASRTVDDRRAMILRHEGDNYDPGYGVEHERLRLIRDTDGDGKADEAIVFADGFKDHAAGIGAGVLSYRGDVYYTCIPDLWLLRDTDGDGRADERSALSSGYGVHVALLGHDLHGLRIGPDRRLYFSSGDRGFHVETERGVIEHPDTGAVLRCNLDGTDLEVWHTGLRNPQELVFDEYGNLFTGDNNSDGGDQARWVHVVEGGDSGWRYSYQWITEPVMRGPWNDEKLWHPPFAGQAAYVLPPIANLAHGPSGLTYNPGTGLGPEFARHFFLCDFRGDPTYSGVHTFTVEPRGAFWELGPVRPFVWNTLVTDIDFGPDGRLYFSDWVAGWNKTGKGRVFRAFDPERIDSAEVRLTHDLLGRDFGTFLPEELASLLGHPDQRVRQEAQFELVDAGRTGHALLREVAAGGPDPLARLHAIWGLGIVGRSGDAAAFEALLPLVADDDPEVRAQATRVLGDERHTPARAAIRARLADAEPRVRFFAALALGRLGDADAVAPLTALLAETGADDPNLRHAAFMGLLGCADAEALADLADHPSPHVRTAVLLVHRRGEDPEVARFLHDAEPALVLEAVRAVHDVPIPAAMGDVAALEPPAGAEAALVRRVLDARLRSGDAAGLARAAQREDLDVAFRAEALEILATWDAPAPRDRVINAWRPVEGRALDEVRPLVDELVAAGLGEGPDELFPALAALVVATGAGEHADLLRAACEDTDRGSEARIAALGGLEALAVPDLRSAVLTALGDPDGGLRAAGIAALERLAPGEALPSLPAILEKGETAERRAAYRILARSDDARATELLAGELERLADGVFPDELELDLVLAVEARADARLTELAGRRSAAAVRDPELAPFLDGLHGGDAERGDEVFRRLDLSCVRCHRAEEGGAEQIGPDLAGVTRRLSRIQVLESIVTPNRRTTPGFDGTVLFLFDGDIVNGRVIGEEDGVVRLLDADGNVIEVETSEIEERRPDLSAMPEDLAKELTREEMRDLLAYLASL